jgi:hypothetical protein
LTTPNQGPRVLPADFYKDPSGRYAYRFWTGSQWTASVVKASDTSAVVMDGEFHALKAGKPKPSDAIDPLRRPRLEFAPKGWYPDPAGAHQSRYWAATHWTERVRNGGRQLQAAIPADARRPVPGTRRTTWLTKHPGQTGCLIVFLAIVLIGTVVGLVSYALGHHGPDRDGAVLACQDFVERGLKAPAGAKFPLLSQAGVSHSGDLFTVYSYVDAQNSFGVRLRESYTCVVQYDHGDWRLHSLTGLR